MIFAMLSLSLGRCDKFAIHKMQAMEKLGQVGKPE
jgi:hypothetical protein